jgi:hypothetical protein
MFETLSNSSELMTSTSAPEHTDLYMEQIDKDTTIYIDLKVRSFLLGQNEISF